MYEFLPTSLSGVISHPFKSSDARVVSDSWHEDSDSPFCPTSHVMHI